MCSIIVHFEITSVRILGLLYVYEKGGPIWPVRNHRKSSSQHYDKFIYIRPNTSLFDHLNFYIHEIAWYTTYIAPEPCLSLAPPQKYVHHKLARPSLKCIVMHENSFLTLKLETQQSRNLVISLA